MVQMYYKFLYLFFLNQPVMNRHSITIPYSEIQKDQLDAKDKELVEAAFKASENAYAPFSQFKVGAAVRLHTGEVLTGSNQENASFPAGICAERSSLLIRTPTTLRQRSGYCRYGFTLWNLPPGLVESEKEPDLPFAYL